MSLGWRFVIIFAVIWIALLWTARKPNIWKWTMMHLGTAAAVLYSADWFRHFRGQPGEGLLPWMTNLREEVTSFAALAAFAVLFSVTVILHIVYGRRTSYRLRFWKKQRCVENTAGFPVIGARETL